MLFETSNQASIFLFLFLGGFLTFGMFFLLFKLLAFKNKIFKWIFDFFVAFAFCLCFFLMNTMLNFGEFRLFSICAFTLGAFVFLLLPKLFKSLKRNKKEG